MGIEMIRVEPKIPDMDIKDGNTSSTRPRALNPRMLRHTPPPIFVAYNFSIMKIFHVLTQFSYFKYSGKQS